MQAHQNLLETPLKSELSIGRDVEKNLLSKKLKPSNLTLGGEEKVIIDSLKEKGYTEPIIPRSAKKDRIEIW